MSNTTGKFADQMLKSRLKDAGIDRRDLAMYLGKTPSAVSKMLNRWVYLTDADRELIERLLQAKEK